MCRTQKMRRYGQEAIMGLYTLCELLTPASAGEYAVGSFNFFGLENLQGRPVGGNGRENRAWQSF